MRTEQLLRETFQDLAGQARTPEVTLGRLRALSRRPRSRRRTLVLVFAAVVVLVLAIAVPAVLVDRVGEPAGRVRGNWDLTHRVEVPPGWEVKTQLVARDFEETSLGPTPGAADGSVSSCTVDVYGPGRGDPTGWRTDRRSVTVNGRPALWSDGSDPTVGPGISWEYQPGAFALVSCGTGRVADDIGVAERVRFEPVPVRLPFRMRSLPRGYSAHVVAPPLTSSDGTFSGGAQFEAENREVRDFRVTVAEGHTTVPPGIPGWETATVAGRPVVLSARDAELCFNSGRHTVCVGAAEGDPEDLTTSLWAAGRRALLVDVAERVVLADDLDDPGTWFPANRAIPR